MVSPILQSRSTEGIRTVRFETTEDHDKNEGRAYEKHGEDQANPCCICGRHTDGSRWVSVGGGGLGPGYGYSSFIIHPDDAQRDIVLDDPGYMGCFDIGPTCARRQKITAEYINQEGA